MEGYLRFDIGNVDGSIWAGDPPGKTLEAMTGRFDPEAIGRLLAACAECPEPEILENAELNSIAGGKT